MNKLSDKAVLALLRLSIADLNSRIELLRPIQAHNFEEFADLLNERSVLEEGYNTLIGEKSGKQLILPNCEVADWRKELELLSENFNDSKEFGFNVEITFVPGYFQGTTQMHYNCTEVHHRYDTRRLASIIDRYGQGHQSRLLAEGHHTAFESHIHGEGGTKQLRYITRIVITNATKIHTDYWEE